MNWRNLIPITSVEIYLIVILYTAAVFFAGIGFYHVYLEGNRFQHGADWILEKVHKEGITVRRTVEK